MPAVVRGGPPKPRRPRAEAPASPSKGKPAPRKAQPAAKLHAARGVGLSPTVALSVAGAALGLGLVVMLATGHRAERLGATMDALGAQATDNGLTDAALDALLADES